jgi:hypothetical protein
MVAVEAHRQLPDALDQGVGLLAIEGADGFA